MSKSVALRVSCLLTFAGVVSCADSIPVSPHPAGELRSVQSRNRFLAEGEVSSVSSVLEEMNAQLAAAGSDQRILKAEFLYEETGFNGANASIVFANDRFKGIGAEWVPGDPRRGGETGVTYALAIGDPAQDVRPETRNPNGTAVRFVEYSELAERLEEGVEAWHALKCTEPDTDVSPKIRLVNIDPTKNPDLFDDLVLGLPFDPDGPNGPLPQEPPVRPLPAAGYVQAADIVQGGWLPRSFFTRVVRSASGASIIGVTLTSAFINPATGQLTDINGDRLADIGRAEIYYQYHDDVPPTAPDRFRFWASTGALNAFDFFSIIAHETGHALGMAHFGKVFIKEKALDDNILFVKEIKFSPLALMNAIYLIPGQIESTDIGQYCNVFGKKN